MNWEAIGAVGELVGAAAVVATLLYVSRQLREQSRALNTTVRDSVFHQLQEWNYNLIADRPLCDLFQRGVVSEDWSEFPPEDQARLFHLFYSFLKVFENIYIHATAGSVSADVWEQNCPILFAYSTQPGFRGYIEQRRRTFDSRFLEVLDGHQKADLQPASQFMKRN